MDNIKKILWLLAFVIWIGMIVANWNDLIGIETKIIFCGMTGLIFIFAGIIDKQQEEINRLTISRST